MSKFKVGDEIIIRNSENEYGITRDGSTGFIIKDVSTYEYIIRFTHTTGPNGSGTRDFPIDKRYVSLLTKLEKALK